jgi:acetoin utilization protein AcuB
MLVQDWMSSKVITVDHDAPILKASKLMKQNGIQHLPVFKEESLIGIISDRDLKEAQPSKATAMDIYELYYLLDELKVSSVMSPNLFTITSEESVEKAAATMLKHTISALPVVNPQGDLEGILTWKEGWQALLPKATCFVPLFPSPVFIKRNCKSVFNWQISLVPSGKLLASSGPTVAVL